MDTSTPAAPTGQKSPGFSLPENVYDIESLHDEVLISSVCFFRDLNAVRDSIRGVWSDYRAGSLGLMTASLLTSTAIEMIHRSTEDHLAMMKRWPDAPEEQNFIYWLYAHICRSDITKRERPQAHINMETYEEAERVSWPVCSFLDDWLAGLHSHQLVFMKQGELDFSRERSCMQPREKLEEDRLYIGIMASQFHNAAKLQLEFPPAIDEITRAFRDVGRTREIPLWLVFAMQIFIDIKGVLWEDIHRGLETLRTTGGRVTTAVQQHFRTSRELKGRQQKWHRENDSQVLKMIRFVAEWVNKDIVSNAVRKHSRQRPEDIGAVVPPFLLLKYHPLLCGLMTYWLNLSIQDFGISLTNAYDTILSAAHLYNAARQSKLLPVAWPDMEYLISIHSEQRLFIGGLPTSSEDFLKRYQLALGASVLNFARNRRAKKTQESLNNGGARRLRKTYPIHDIFRGRYCAMDNRSNLAIEKVDAVFALEASKSLDRDHSTITIYRNQWALTRKLSSTQLLDVLRHALQQDELHMHFDYVSMHARCAILLANLRSSFIASADALTQRPTASDTETQRSLQLDDVCEDFTPARYIEELAMPEHDVMFIALTNSVFISDPVGAAVAEKFDSNAPIESLMLRECDVSLEKVAIAMSGCIEQEGRLEVEKAKRAVKQIGLDT